MHSLTFVLAKDQWSDTSYTTKSDGTKTQFNPFPAEFSHEPISHSNGEKQNRSYYRYAILGDFLLPVHNLNLPKVICSYVYIT